MQRIGNDFFVKRSVQIYSQDNGGMIKELFELPSGQWQFGKGRDAQVVTTLEQVKEFDEGTQTAVQKWLDRTKNQPVPQPIIAGGPTPMLAGDSVRDRLGRAISMMSEEVVNRLLTAIESTVGPVADSITQEAPINHHSDGFGQDQHTPVPGAVPFTLPEGAWWAEQGRPEVGYYTVDPEVKDERGQPTKRWHATPQFHAYVEQAPEKTSVVELEMEAEQAKYHQEEQDRQLAGAGSNRSRRRR